MSDFRSLNERVHGRLKRKFRALSFWAGDRERGIISLEEPAHLVFAWTICSVLHNVDIQEHPMGLHGVDILECDASLWGWPLYDPRIDCMSGEEGEF